MAEYFFSDFIAFLGEIISTGVPGSTQEKKALA